MRSADVIATAIKLFQPQPRVDERAWLKRHILFPPRQQPKGFDSAAYPHVTAPGGPLDAWADPKIRVIWLQWGTRLAKTATAQALLCKQAATDPCEMLFGTATQELAGRISTKKLYPMLEMCGPLRDQLKPPRLRKQTRVDLDGCTIYVAWSGSTSALADLGARVGHANEVDKWDTDVSSEGDPLKLFLERFNEFPNRKIIAESTPGIRGRSRVERGLLQSTNCRYWVPCPHCGGFQVLVLAQVKWQHEDGKSTPELAYETAHYQCEHCDAAILDEHRGAMMRAGIWAPDGCQVEAGGTVSGTPIRTGPDAGYQLSGLYALARTWGDIAREFVSCHNRPRDLQNFINAWLGETFEIRSGAKRDWQTLGEALDGGFEPGKCPENVRLVTCGVDVQSDHLVYWVVGWDAEGSRYLLDHEIVESWDELERAVLDRRYEHSDRGERPGISLTLVDSGYRTDEVYAFCARASQSGRWVLPCKGFQNLGGETYKISSLDGAGRSQLARKRRALSGRKLVHINVNYWQQVVQRSYDTLKAGDRGALNLNREAATDQDALEQLLNEAPQRELDAKGYEKLVWTVVHDHIPVDFRDCDRMACVAARILTRGNFERLPGRGKVAASGGEKPARKAGGAEKRNLQRPAVQFIERPGGWV